MDPRVITDETKSLMYYAVELYFRAHSGGKSLDEFPDKHERLVMVSDRTCPCGMRLQKWDFDGVPAPAEHDLLAFSSAQLVEERDKRILRDLKKQLVYSLLVKPLEDRVSALESRLS